MCLYFDEVDNKGPKEGEPEDFKKIVYDAFSAEDWPPFMASMPMEKRLEPKTRMKNAWFQFTLPLQYKIQYSRTRTNMKLTTRIETSKE